MARLILLAPYSRSANVIGTSTIRRPAWTAQRQVDLKAVARRLDRSRLIACSAEAR